MCPNRGHKTSCQGERSMRGREMQGAGEGGLGQLVIYEMLRYLSFHVRKLWGPQLAIIHCYQLAGILSSDFPWVPTRRATSKLEMSLSAPFSQTPLLSLASPDLFVSIKAPLDMGLKEGHASFFLLFFFFFLLQHIQIHYLVLLKKRCNLKVRSFQPWNEDKSFRAGTGKFTDETEASQSHWVDSRQMSGKGIMAL